jgi:iron complex transport system permease protein
MLDTLPSGRGATPGRTRAPARSILGAAILLAAVAVVSVASVLIGARQLPLSALLEGDHPLHAVYEARLDRTLVALVVGATLGLAGACMQGLTRNPLADPGILGVHAGACFAMVLAISLLGVSELSDYVWFAFLGAGVAAVLVHAIASLGRDGATPMKLAIAGAALTAALTSWTSGMLLVDRKTMETFRMWQVGTVGGRSIDLLLVVLPFLALGTLLALAGARLLNTLALGDDVARGLGRRTTRDRIVLGLAIVLLSGGTTALAGPIAFIGLIVPHGVRALVGSDYMRILPLSAVLGAVLLVSADVVGRVVLPPAEVQVGIMSAVIGVPFFLLLVKRGRMGSL